MIIDTHTHVVSSDKVKHPLDPGARGWSTEVSNNVEDLIAEMDRAGVDCATLVQPNATYALDNSYQCDSAKQYAPRTVAVGILDPTAPDAADKLSYWVNERGMNGVRLQSQAEPDDSRCDILWQRAEALGIPISIGGRSDAALRRTARYGDAWTAIWVSARRMAEAREKIDEWAKEEGREDARIGLGLQVWYGLDDDRDEARRRLAKRMQDFYKIPFERFERYSPYGRPEEIAEFLVPYVEAGCDHFNLLGVQSNQDEVVEAALAVKAALEKLL